MEKYYVYVYLDERIKIEEEYCGIYFNYRPIYIGKGKNNRMYEHLENYKRSGKTYFYKKLNKMINSNNKPLIEKIKTFDNELDAFNFEIEIISKLKKVKEGGYLYNLTNGGEGVSGYKHTKKTKKKLSIKRRLRITTEETKMKMSESQKGKVLSDEHKEKLRIANIGVKKSEESKRKMSDAKLGKPTWNKGMIKDIILQIDIDGNIVKEWNNLIELEEAGYQKSNVINVCVGKRKSHKGFIWIYKGDYKISEV